MRHAPVHIKGTFEDGQFDVDLNGSGIDRMTAKGFLEGLGDERIAKITARRGRKGDAGDVITVKFAEQLTRKPVARLKEDVRRKLSTLAPRQEQPTGTNPLDEPTDVNADGTPLTDTVDADAPFKPSIEELRANAPVVTPTDVDEVLTDQVMALGLALTGKHVKPTRSSSMDFVRAVLTQAAAHDATVELSFEGVTAKVTFGS